MAYPARTILALVKRHSPRWRRHPHVALSQPTACIDMKAILMRVSRTHGSSLAVVFFTLFLYFLSPSVSHFCISLYLLIICSISLSLSLTHSHSLSLSLSLSLSFFLSFFLYLSIYLSIYLCFCLCLSVSILSLSLWISLVCADARTEKCGYP